MLAKVKYDGKASLLLGLEIEDCLAGILFPFHFPYNGSTSSRARRPERGDWETPQFPREGRRGGGKNGGCAKLDVKLRPFLSTQEGEGKSREILRTRCAAIRRSS